MSEFIATYTDKTTELRHVWEHTVGSGHASLALRADWQKQLERCRRELGFQRVRFHGLLSHPLDTLVHQNDEWMFSFFDCDQIFDFLLSIGITPFVELSFMPDALASGDKTAFNYRANVSMPNDFDKWSELIEKLVGHFVDRYGLPEVRKWHFEVWNEPNLDVFGLGGQGDYFTLYAATVRAVKRVDSSLMVGGPATAKSEWIEDFVHFVDSAGLPADFISTHQYPTDAFGSSGDDTEEQLAKSTRGFMLEKTQDAKREAGDRPLFYTEWNTSSNPRDHLHDEPFTAAFACKILMDIDGVADAYSWWTFTDIFSENYMPSVPFQGGFGLLTIHGIAKPVYRAFQLLHALGSRRMIVDGVHETVSVWMIGSDDGNMKILLTNHALPKHSITTESTIIRVLDSPKPEKVSVERIDDAHANAKARWTSMSEPEYPDSEQLAELHEASEMIREPLSFQYSEGVLELKVSVMPHAVACITVEFNDGLKADTKIKKKTNRRRTTKKDESDKS